LSTRLLYGSIREAVVLPAKFIQQNREPFLDPIQLARHILPFTCRIHPVRVNQATEQHARTKVGALQRAILLRHTA
jgi:hypothetical protein